MIAHAVAERFGMSALQRIEEGKGRMESRNMTEVSTYVSVASADGIGMEQKQQEERADAAMRKLMGREKEREKEREREREREGERAAVAREREKHALMEEALATAVWKKAMQEQVGDSENLVLEDALRSAGAHEGDYFTGMPSAYREQMLQEAIEDGANLFDGEVRFLFILRGNAQDRGKAQ